MTDRGSTTVELALTLPLLVGLLLGVLDLGRAANAYLVVDSASREGARYAILHPTAAPEDVASSVKSRVTPLDPDAVSVTVSFHDGTTFAPWPAGGIPLSPGGVRGIPIEVTVRYPWAAASALVASLLGPSTHSFASTSRMEVRR